MNPPETSNEDSAPSRRRVCYEMFRGGMTTSWDELFGSATAFAEGLPPGALINISHSDSQRNGIVVVWYWSDAEATDPSGTN